MRNQKCEECGGILIFRNNECVCNVCGLIHESDCMIKTDYHSNITKAEMNGLFHYEWEDAIKVSYLRNPLNSRKNYAYRKDGELRINQFGIILELRTQFDLPRIFTREFAFIYKRYGHKCTYKHKIYMFFYICLKRLTNYSDSEICERMKEVTSMFSLYKINRYIRENGLTHLIPRYNREQHSIDIIDKLTIHVSDKISKEEFVKLLKERTKRIMKFLNVYTHKSNNISLMGSIYWANQSIKRDLDLHVKTISRKEISEIFDYNYDSLCYVIWRTRSDIAKIKKGKRQNVKCLS